MDLRIGVDGLGVRVPETPCGPEARGWSDDHVILLGQLVGDGSYLKGQPLRYATASEANSAAVRGAAEALGARVKRYSGRGRWHQLLISGNGNRWHASGVGKWLKDLGIHGQRNHEKRLPREVFSLSDAQVALLLRHLWAADGSILPRRPARRAEHDIHFATSSPGLAADVVALLGRFGIVASVRQAAKGARPCCQVAVSGPANQRAFLDCIGAFGPSAGAAAELRILLDAAGS